MNRFIKPVTLFFVLLCWIDTGKLWAQCTTLGQTPTTAFPVCGNTVFQQTTVPLCTNNPNLYTPCTDGAAYADKNPFYYKFTCFVGGTLGFIINPLAANEDYDWQLYDITGKNPNDVLTDRTLLVTGNWAGVYGATGASAAGVNFIQCSSTPTANVSTFAVMPVLIVGHEYLLMISHFTDGQSGYDLSFGSGSAVITDPLKPHMVKVTPDCDGKKITLKLNKKVRCNTITGSGSEFSLLPASSTAVSAVTDSCAFGFDFDKVVITLSSALTSGTHQLIINNGTDANTLLDNCDNIIPVGESISFDYFIPQPILADSVGKMPCTPDSILVYYPKKIKCSSLSPGGGDFTVTGPTSVTVVSAGGSCVNDLTDYVVVKFAAPVYTKGIYTLFINPGIDGSPIFDVCGQPILPQSFQFSTVDTVSALFSYSSKLGCQRDTLTFAHNGAHDVNSWNWVFNNGSPVTTQTHTIIFSAASTNTVQLIVSNGVCRDTANSTIVLNNEVKALFTMPSIICPEDGLTVTNNSTGQIDKWLWKFDVIGTSNVKDPLPFLFPSINREAYYTVKLIATNTLLNCSDSSRKTLTVLDFCLIDVPTAFTPNNDGLNDYFRPHNALKADGYDFRVFNRWGQMVFQSNNWQDKWDGRVKGAIQNTGTFVWMLSYTSRDTKQKIFKKGLVTLIR